MSFVYARKIENNILILGDTKITLDEAQLKSLWKDEKLQNDVKNYGVIKNIVLANTACICFAGEIKEANELLSIAVKNNFQIDDLCKAAFEIHTKYNEPKVDFLLCFCDGEQQFIYQIKDKQMNEVNQGWIGSPIAFNFFQKKMLSKTSKESGANKCGQDISVSYSVQDNTDAQKVFDAFFDTIYQCGDDEVGGFPVKVLYNQKENSFEYSGYIKKKSFMKQLEEVNLLRNTAQDGDYSIMQYYSKKLVGLYIPNANLGLIYSNIHNLKKGYTSVSSKMLFTPYSRKISELDYFILGENDGLRPPGFLSCDPDNYEEIYKRINFYKGTPSILILYIDKLIEIIKRMKVHEEDLADLDQLRNETIENIDATK